MKHKQNLKKTNVLTIDNSDEEEELVGRLFDKKSELSLYDISE